MFSANIHFWVNYSFNNLFLKQALFQNNIDAAKPIPNKYADGMKVSEKVYW